MNDTTTKPSKPSKPLRFRVIPAEQGLTLRNLLARRIGDLGVKGSAELIRRGGVYMNRLRVRLPSVLVAAGERITVYREALTIAPVDPDSLVFVHRERDFVILDKPAGVPVAAIRESAVGNLGEALVRRLAREGVSRPYVGVVHRLDRGASGLVLFTIRSVANKSLHKQFRTHEIGRSYRLRTLDDQSNRGSAPPVPEQITVDTPLVRLHGGGVKLGRRGDANAIPAITHLRHIARIELESGAPTQVAMEARVEHIWDAQLETGRTHQIRAHVASLGYPIVGDHRYGPGGGPLEALSDEDEDESDTHARLLLHAWKLDFEHPTSGERMHFETALPEWAREATSE